MNFITRNNKFDIDDYRAFEIYSNSTCEYLEFTCNYYNMIEVMEDNISMMVNNGLIDSEEAWLIRDDYITYDQKIYSLENGDF